jgi:hypothetical protein
MKTCRSKLGAYIAKQRSILGVKRTALAQWLGCERESIVLLEQTGDDEEGVLQKLIEALGLDLIVVERRLARDKKRRRKWLEFCDWRQPPVIMPAGKPRSSPVTIPEVIVAVGIEAVEEYARDFARDWDRTIELFVRNHVRFVISPAGQMDINEMGFYQPWVDEKAEP